jgi:hypothetical protein
MNLESLAEILAGKLIGQDPGTGEIPQPKAHDSINSIMKESLPLEHQTILNNILENIATGGMGGTIKTGAKAYGLIKAPKYELARTPKKQFSSELSDQPFHRVQTYEYKFNPLAKIIYNYLGDKNLLWKILANIKTRPRRVK